jgi:hypothetical protein
MKYKEHILELIKAQDLVRRVWANLDNAPESKPLRKIDIELTNIINQLGQTK